MDITTKNDWGFTPETNARKQGHAAIVSLLQEHAASS